MVSYNTNMVLYTLSLHNLSDNFENYYKHFNYFVVLNRKSGVNKDKCLVAQEMLHPECAQRADGPAKVPCHYLAESCRGESDCR